MESQPGAEINTRPSKAAHQRVQLPVKMRPETRILQLFESVAVARDVRRVKDDVVAAEQPTFEIPDCLRQVALSIVLIDDDPAEHEKWILRVDYPQIVVSGLVEEKHFHAPTTFLIAVTFALARLRGFSHLQLDAHAGVAEHVDERIQAEIADLAAHEVVQPRLGDAELLRGLALRHAAHGSANTRHQLRAQHQVVRLVGWESHIEEHVSATAGDLQFAAHRRFLS